MTQKDAIKNILLSYDFFVARHIFILEWLQDINWHTEHKLYWDSLPKPIQSIIESAYELKPFQSTHPSEMQSINGYQFNCWMYRDIQNAKQDYRTFNRIFGFGTNIGEWENDTGEKMIEEIKELLPKE